MVGKGLKIGLLIAKNWALYFETEAGLHKFFLWGTFGDVKGLLKNLGLAGIKRSLWGTVGSRLLGEFNGDYLGPQIGITLGVGTRLVGGGEK